LDRTLVVDEVVAGAIHRPHAVVEVAGGKGFNVARAAHRLGAALCTVGILGGHTGAFIGDLLREERIDARVVHSSVPTRTCMSVACSRTQALTEFYEPAGPVDAQVWACFEDELGKALAGNTGWMTVSGSLPAGAPEHGMARLLATARSHGFRVAVDTHGDSLRTAVTARPDLVKVNTAEAAALVGREAPAEELVREMHDVIGGTGMTVVTAGADGAWAVSDGAVLHVLPLTRGGFPVGSGDCFLAGLVTGLDRGDDAAGALRLAAATATANALVPGAADFDTDAAARLYAAAETHVVSGVTRTCWAGTESPPGSRAVFR
jgi:1-phosphofructokinase family hexose kinase